MSLYARLKPGFQKRVVDANVELVRKVLQKETLINDRQVTVSPTGSGKTFMMASVIEVGLRLPIEPSFVWVTHNRQLLLQTENEVREALGNVVTTVYHIEQNIQSFGGRVLLFNVQKGVSSKAKQWLRQWSKYQTDLQRPIVFIVDEADEGMSGKNMGGLREAINPILELGFTASFVRKENESEFFRVSYDEVITAGMLVDHVDYQASEEVGRAEMFSRAIAQRELLEERAQGLKFIGRYFVPKMLIQAPASECESVARDLAAMLSIDSENFRRTVIVHTQNSRGLDEVDDMSEVRYIIGDLMVERGWNCPEAYVLLSTKDSVSQRKGIQLLGRVIRLPGCASFDERFEAFNRGYVYISGKHAIENSAKNFGGDESILLPPPREVIQVTRNREALLPEIITFIDELDKDIEDRDLIPVSDAICDAMDELRRQCDGSDPTIRSGSLNLSERSVEQSPVEAIRAEWNLEQAKKMLIDSLARHIPRNYANLVVTKFQIRRKETGGLLALAPYAREIAEGLRKSSVIRRVTESLDYVHRPTRWPPHKLVLARPLPLSFQRSLYAKMQLNEEETRLAVFLDKAAKTHGFWWVRNDVNDVKVSRSNSPDFIVFTQHSYVFLEYKGKHLLNTADSVYKNYVSQKAQAYFMVYIDGDDRTLMVRARAGEEDELFTESILMLALRAKRPPPVSR